MSEQIKRPNIAQLEKLINETNEGEVEVLPNGNVVRLSPQELVEKRLRLAQEKVDVLKREVVELREGLKRILKEIDELVGRD